MCDNCEEVLLMEERVLATMAIIEAAQNAFMEAYRLCRPEATLDEIEKAWQKSNTCSVLAHLVTDEEQHKENLH